MDVTIAIETFTSRRASSTAADSGTQYRLKPDLTQASKQLGNPEESLLTPVCDPLNTKFMLLIARLYSRLMVANKPDVSPESKIPNLAIK